MQTGSKQNGAQPPTRLRRIAVVWCVLAVFGATLEIAITVKAAANGWFGDFPHYYAGARRVTEGKIPYGPLTSTELADLALDARHYPTYRNYPADLPPTIALLSPLGQLPFGWAWAGLTAVSAALLFLALHATARHVGFSQLMSVAIASSAFATIPGRGLLYWGHMESFVLIAIVLGWIAVRTDRNATGAAWWTLAAGLKAFPAVLLMPLVRRRAGRSITGAAAAALGIAVATTAVLGVDIWQVFVTDVIPLARIWEDTIGNLSLVGVLGSLGASPTISRTGAIVVGLAGTAWLIARPGPPDRWLIAGTSLGLLVSPLVWVFYYVIIFPALVVLAATLDPSRPGRVLSFAALALVLTLWPAYVGEESLVSTAMSAAVRPLALVVLFIWGMRMDWRTGLPLDLD